MIRLIKIIFYLSLLVASFMFGVKYSKIVKEASEWLFETKEQEINFREIEKDLKNNLEKKVDNTMKQKSKVNEDKIIKENNFLKENDELVNQRYEELITKNNEINSEDLDVKDNIDHKSQEN